MSGDAIKPGDLVMVVRGMPCCGATGEIKFGAVFTVAGLRIIHGACKVCGVFYNGIEEAKHAGNHLCTPTQMLKRIDPPETGDSLPTHADIEAPA